MLHMLELGIALLAIEAVVVIMATFVKAMCAVMEIMEIGR